VHLEPLAIHESDGVVTLRYTLAGTNDGAFYGQPATGRRFEVENCTLLEVREGRVRRAWRYSDTLGLLTQLGLAPDTP
jgi:predicted ester cyclase